MHWWNRLLARAIRTLWRRASREMEAERRRGARPCRCRDLFKRWNKVRSRLVTAEAGVVVKG